MEIEKKTGIKTAALLNRPELSVRWQFADALWSKIGGSRNWTAAGPAQIPISEFLAWCDLTDYPKPLRATTWDDLHTFDAIWLSVKHKIDEAKQASEQRKSSKKSRR